MEGKRVTAEQVKAVWAEEYDRMAQAAAEAMNAARDGAIIADSEEPFRDASAEFRRGAYEKLLGLLQDKQEAFSPSTDRTSVQGNPVGDAPDDQRTGGG